MKVLVVLLHLLFAIQNSLADRMIIHTSNQTGVQYEFFPLRTNHLQFSVKASNDIYVCLTNTPALSPPYYEIGIGTWANTKTIIRKDNHEFKKTHFGKVLNPNKFQTIWVTINETEGSISVGKHISETLLYYVDPDFVRMSYFGISTGYGAHGVWNFDFKMFNCRI